PPPPPPEQRAWDKEVWLVPQDIPMAAYLTICQEAYAGRHEVTFSADAAFDRPGKARSQKVRVYNAAAWGGRQELEKWIMRHYTFSPATVVEYREAPAAAGGF